MYDNLCASLESEMENLNEQYTVGTMRAATGYSSLVHISCNSNKHSQSGFRIHLDVVQYSFVQACII